MTESFEFQPTLKGPTSIVRPIQANDWTEMYCVASDPKIWELHPANERYKEAEFRSFFDEALNSGSAFALIDRASQKIIGSSRYHGFDVEMSEVEIGWTFLARTYWGGNTNREIKQLMLNHAFNYVETAIFWVGETNFRSRRAMEKIGGILRQGTVFRTLNSSRHPHVIYEIKKSDYLNTTE